MTFFTFILEFQVLNHERLIIGTLHIGQISFFSIHAFKQTLWKTWFLLQSRITISFSSSTLKASRQIAQHSRSLSPSYYIGLNLRAFLFKCCYMLGRRFRLILSLFDLEENLTTKNIHITSIDINVVTNNKTRIMRRIQIIHPRSWYILFHFLGSTFTTARNFWSQIYPSAQTAKKFAKTNKIYPCFYKPL